ncbi:uncharacterized protein EV420DRAFT_1642516 [Desarmillaria tabescens]|uniref:Uncharacterized protein n=1 Tax=Armillaria tabescens TaxID=1929756 RepID=A0AA39N676_ARMTA|nr:uncharacterized protein EV420DRAFT_1642516 [Desarmillaria tabescens]KAK0458795.1 hypothetical protein EV420DRAFT_1642516 [Desarmillaria tabescens]
MSSPCQHQPPTLPPTSPSSLCDMTLINANRDKRPSRPDNNLRRARRPLNDENSRFNCHRCRFSTNLRALYLAHEQRYHSSPRQRCSRQVYICQNAPYCTFQAGSRCAVVRHQRAVHGDHFSPLIVHTPESLALDGVIITLTNLAVNLPTEAGSSASSGPVASTSTAMAVDDAVDTTQNQPSMTPAPFDSDGMEQ